MKEIVQTTRINESIIGFALAVFLNCTFELYLSHKSIRLVLMRYHSSFKLLGLLKIMGCLICQTCWSSRGARITRVSMTITKIMGVFAQLSVVILILELTVPVGRRISATSASSFSINASSKSTATTETSSTAFFSYSVCSEVAISRSMAGTTACPASVVISILVLVYSASLDSIRSVLVTVSCIGCF